MLNKQRHINTIQELLSNDYTLNIQKDYGDAGISNLKAVLETIPHIFKNIHLKKFDSILIFKSDTFKIEEHTSNYNLIQNYTHLASMNNSSLTIQVKNIDEIIVCTTNIPIADIIISDFVYQYTPQKEMFHTCTTICNLPKVPGADSCFAISTFKELDEALYHYKTSVAKYSECQHLKSSMYSDNRILFKPHPEYLLRDSLVYFLRARLRGEGLEVRPEQNVDTSHPVDVKVLWGSTNHIALIEVKWLGKSLGFGASKFSSNYTASRARDGAFQLANYLDANNIQVPNHNTVGYLVVFDLRRRKTRVRTVEINQNDGFWYQDKEIEYDPKYHEIRNDFAIPIRMFITPQYIDNGN